VPFHELLKCLEAMPPNYAEILGQPERNPPVNNALEGEALRALDALQRQVLDELPRSRRHQGLQRMLEAERHDRLFQAVQANHRQQEPAPNPDNQINVLPLGNNAACPQNILPPTNFPEHRNVQNIPIVDVGHATPQRRANLQVDEPPPPYNMMFPEGNEVGPQPSTLVGCSSSKGQFQLSRKHSKCTASPNLSIIWVHNQDTWATFRLL
jgi:hypothetical protein